MKKTKHNYSLFTKIAGFRMKNILSISLDDKPAPVRIVLKMFIFFYRVIFNFIKDQCLMRSSGLAFSTLLALVPLSAVILSMFSAFGGFSEVRQSIQGFFLNALIPARQDEFMNYLNAFVENTRALGAVGLLLFTFTSIFLLVNIGNNFNAIWGIKSKRSFISKFTTYTSVLVFGSIFVAASFSFGTWLTRLLSSGSQSELNIILQFIVNAMPSLFILLTFILFFIIVPEVRISFSSAFIGALGASVLWETAKFIFGTWANQSIQMSVIYGSIALIPISLLWLYIAWLIILIGLEITYVHQHKKHPFAGASIENIPPQKRLHFGLEIYARIAEAFVKGEKPPNLHTLANHFSTSVSDIHFFVKLFEASGKLLSTGSERWGWVPSRPPNLQKLEEVISVLWSEGHMLSIHSDDESRVLKIVKRFNTSAFESIKGITVSEAFALENGEERKSDI
ncbi:MAG: YihY family inner membrane protein [Spirochaetia bacterium]